MGEPGIFSHPAPLAGASTAHYRFLDRCHAKIFNLSLRPLQMFQVVVSENARKFLPAERQLREINKNPGFSQGTSFQLQNALEQDYPQFKDIGKFQVRRKQ